MTPDQRVAAFWAVLGGVLVLAAVFMAVVVGIGASRLRPDDPADGAEDPGTCHAGGAAGG